MRGGGENGTRADRIRFGNDREGRRRRQVREAYRELINRYPWSHYATLTFHQAATDYGARRVFQRFTRRLDLKAPGFWWCRVIEHGWAGGRTHLHALLGGTGDLPPQVIDRAWGAGRSNRIEPFDPGRGGIRYLTKDLIYSEELDLDFAPDIDRRVRDWTVSTRGGADRVRSP